MNELVLSEIQISPIKFRDGLVAFASCVINGQLYLGSLAIYSSPSSSLGYRLVYPSRAVNGTQLSIAHPITKEAGFVIQKQIVERYIKLMENLTKGEEDGQSRHT